MPHASLGIAVVLEETLHLELLHPGLHGSHDLAMGGTAHLVHVTHDSQLPRSLDHATNRRIEGGVIRREMVVRWTMVKGK